MLTRKARAQLGHWSGLTPMPAATWSPDGRFALVGASPTRLVEIASGRELWQRSSGTGTFSADSRWVLLEGPDGQIVDAALGTTRRGAPEGSGAEFSQDKRFIWWPVSSNSVELLDAATLRVQERVEIQGELVGHVLSPRGRYAALTLSRDDGAVVRFVDLETGRAEERPASWNNRLVFSPDERFAAFVGPEAAPSMWLWSSAPEQVRELRHRACAPEVTPLFSDSGRLLATGGSLDTVCLWDVESGRLVRRLPSPPARPARTHAAVTGGPLEPEAFTTSEHVLVVSSGFASRVYQIATGRELLRGAYRFVAKRGDRLLFDGMGGALYADPPPAGTEQRPDVAIVGDDGSVRLLELGVDDQLTSVVTSPGASNHGRVLLAGGSLVVLDIAQARALGRHAGVGSGRAALDPSGERVLSVSDNGLELWSAVTGETLLGSLRPTLRVRAIAFEPPAALTVLGEDGLRYSFGVVPKPTARAAPVPGCHALAVDLARAVGAERDSRGELRVCDLASGRVLARHDAMSAFWGRASFGREGRALLVEGDSATLWDWSAGTWTALPWKWTGNAVLGPRDQVAVANFEHGVEILRPFSGELVRRFELTPAGSGTAEPLAWSPDGTYLVASDPATTHGVDLPRGARLDLGPAAAAAAFDGQGLVALASAGAVAFRRTSDGSLTGTLRIAVGAARARADAAGPVSALWQDAQGQIELVGERAPWLASTRCHVGETSVPADLCFGVLESPGAALRILQKGR